MHGLDVDICPDGMVLPLPSKRGERGGAIIIPLLCATWHLFGFIRRCPSVTARRPGRRGANTLSCRSTGHYILSASSAVLPQCEGPLRGCTLMLVVPTTCRLTSSVFSVTVEQTVEPARAGVDNIPTPYEAFPVGSEHLFIGAYGTSRNDQP